MAFLAGFPGGSSLALAENALEPEKVKQVDGLFADHVGEDRPGAAIAVVKDGRVAYSRGYGMANLEYQIPNTPQTIFHVASVSKQFTCFAVLLLADEGKLSLDDDVRAHLGWFPDLGHAITLRQLMHHTSGIRDQWELLQIENGRVKSLIPVGDHVFIDSRSGTEIAFGTPVDGVAPSLIRRNADGESVEGKRIPREEWAGYVGSLMGRYYSPELGRTYQIVRHPQREWPRIIMPRFGEFALWRVSGNRFRSEEGCPILFIEFDAGHLLLSPGFSLNLPPRSAIQSPSDFNETVSSKNP